MLILDKDLALERMVSVASRPSVPEPFRRTEPAIEAIFVAAADGPPARRLARTLVLAGSRDTAPEVPRTGDPLPHRGPVIRDEAASETRPVLIPEARPLESPATADADARGLIERLAQFLRPARPASSATPRQAFLHRESIRISGWHVRPADFR